MPIQRQIKTLLQEEIETLKELYKDDLKGWRVRYRAHIILLINSPYAKVEKIYVKYIV